MNTPQPELLLRLLFILHRAWIEARMLTQREAWSQLYDLSDAIETLPAAISRWTEHELEATRFNLTTYETKYPENSFQYTQYLDMTTPPPPSF